MAGDDDRTFALSQMLIGEAEDLYAGLQRFNPTVYQALGSGFPKADTRAQVRRVLGARRAEADGVPPEFLPVRQPRHRLPQR